LIQEPLTDIIGVLVTVNQVKEQSSATAAHSGQVWPTNCSSHTSHWDSLHSTTSLSFSYMCVWHTLAWSSSSHTLPGFRVLIGQCWLFWTRMKMPC